jgi:hypothetical protein
MPAFPFKSILLHTLPDTGGWEIIGVSHLVRGRRTVIAVLDPVAGEDLARLLASAAALQLAGQYSYDED